MCQKGIQPRYALYRNLPSTDSRLASLFQKLDDSPISPKSHFELGEAAHRTGLLELSKECFSEVTRLAPHVAAGYFNLGNVLFDLKQFQNALIAYEQAFQLQPDAGTLINMGNAFAALQDYDKSVVMFDRALAIEAGPNEDAKLAYRNKGLALMASKDWANAAANYANALLRFPTEIGFHESKAICHRTRCEFGQAMESLVRATVISPDNPDLLCQIADLNFKRGRTMESVLCLNQAFSIKFPSSSLQSQRLRMLCYCAPSTPDQILREATSWASFQSKKGDHVEFEPLAAMAEMTKMVEKGSEPYLNRSIRVGVMCSTLNSRGLGDWLPQCLIQSNLKTLQWIVYCDGPIRDDIRKILTQAECRWTETSQFSDSQLASLISSDRLHILIDMIGHGYSTRLQVIAKKPAPLLISWCAFPMTSGLEEMDFIWSDSICIPSVMESSFSERVIRFPKSSQYFFPPCELNLSTELQLTHSAFRCGFLGLPEQLTDRMVETLSTLLNRIPDAELVFLSDAYRDLAFQTEVRARIEKQLPSPSRIRFLSNETDDAELEAYQQLDVSLDSYFVNSPQRAFESLWMGVPVITPLDDRLSGRGTASILNAIQKQAWIADSQAGYVAAVEQLAEIRQATRSQRESLRADLISSCLCNVELMSSNILDAIRETIRQTMLMTKTDSDVRSQKSKQ